MNKTININLGGLFFHIDEDAYQKLNRYFDAVKKSLSNSSGHEEIMKDIEMRVSEIFSENQKTDNSVVSLKDVDAMITIMGQPEDYRIEEENGETFNNTNYNYRPNKKLYRDVDNNVLGGIAAGFGHYFGVDSLWIRLGLALFVIAGVGFPFILYIILWVLIPKALTTSEKIEMTGEPVNLSNIEKKVREEFENVSEKIKNADYNKMGSNMQSGAEKIGSTLGEIFMMIFKIFAKFIGGIIVLVSISTLAGLVISFFTLGSTSLVDMPWQKYYEAAVVSEYPLFLIGTLSVFAIGIPFFFLLILGLKLLITNMKSIGSIAKYTLLALWIISVLVLVSFGIKQATEVAYSGKVVKKEIINYNLADTLEIKFKFNNYYAKGFFYNNDFEITQDENGNDIIYSNNIRLKIIETEEALPYLQVEKLSEGKSSFDAKQRAEKIKYTFKLEGSKLILDNYYITDLKNKFRDQEVKLYLYLPKGIILKVDDSVENHTSSYDSFFNLHFNDNKSFTYKINNHEVVCLNCGDEFNDLSDSIKTISVKINDIEIIRSETKSKTFKLEVDKNGIIRKTNKND